MRKASTHPTTWTNARRSETRVKERADHLPPVIWGRLDGTPPSSRAMPMKKPSSRLMKSHTRSTIPKGRNAYSQTRHRRSSCLKRRLSLMIRRSSKMKRLATTTRRGSDEIEAKEREAIGQRRTENVDQRNRKETPERSRRRFREETRCGDKIRIAPSKRARATGGKSRLYSSKRPWYTGDRVIKGNRRRESKLHLIIFLVKDTRERTRKREELH